MWNWLKKILPTRHQPDLETAEEALIARLFRENSELRAIVVQLDATVTDLSIQLWGKTAYDRAVANAAKNGNN